MKTISFFLYMNDINNHVNVDDALTKFKSLSSHHNFFVAASPPSQLTTKFRPLFYFLVTTPKLMHFSCHVVADCCMFCVLLLLMLQPSRWKSFAQNRFGRLLAAATRENPQKRICRYCICVFFVFFLFWKAKNSWLWHQEFFEWFLFFFVFIFLTACLH